MTLRGRLTALMRVLVAAGMAAGMAAGTAAGAHGHGLGEHPAGPVVEAPAGGAAAQARSLVAEYHRHGDDALLAQGWGVLDSALASRPDAATLLAAAWLAQAEHRFELAQDYLGQTLERRPDHPEAWLLRASVALVQGDVETAREACGRAGLGVPLAATTACFARTAAATAGRGDIARRYQRLASVLAAQPPAEPALAGWVHGVAADLAMRGGLDAAAETHFLKALAIGPALSQRAGYADLLLATDRPEAVLAVIDSQATAPALALRRLIALERLGRGPGPERLASIDVRFQRWLAAGDLRHAREMALFYLSLAPQPARADALALENYARQREPEDLVLLCAAAAAVARSDPRCPTTARVSRPRTLAWIPSVDGP